MHSSTRASARILACLAAGAALFVPLHGASRQTVTPGKAVERALTRSPQVDQQRQGVDDALLTRKMEAAAVVAVEDLRAVLAHSEMGAPTFLDALLGRNGSTQADTDLITARNHYIPARAELDAIPGREL